MTASSLFYLLRNPSISGKDKCWALKQLTKKHGFKYDEVMELIGR